MSAEALALLVGAILATGALVFVLQPLFSSGADEPAVPAVPDDPAAADSAIVALREIEFDRATGKLSDADYAELTRAHSARALREMRQEDVALDAIEARVRAVRARHRECATCGVRPEPDALYCSTCGAAL